MRARNWNRAAVLSVLALGAAAPAVSFACCPSGGNGGSLLAPASTTGLGESQPAATDVSTDSSWSVYQFARGGMNYTQINDANGVVRAVVGNIGSTAWVLPAGKDADRVRLPGDLVPAGNRRTIYKSTKIEVVEIESVDGLYWFIVPAETSAY